MGSRSLELGWSLKQSYVPKTIGNLLNDLSKIDDVPEKLSVLFDYLVKCEEELSRVEAFKRELPQCMLLLMDAIETLKMEIINIKNPKEPESAKSLIEFLPMKRKDYENEQMVLSDDPGMNSSAGHPCQLWNPIPDKKQKVILPSRALSLTPPNQPFRMRNTEVPVMAANESSSFFKSSAAEKQRESKAAPFPRPEAVGPVGLNLRTDPVTLNYYPVPLAEVIWKNNRRCWSPQLHARFVDVLNTLGGEKEATPKLIRLGMQIEGLTNDLVKSHLQKYRMQAKIPGAEPDPKNWASNPKDQP